MGYFDVFEAIKTVEAAVKLPQEPEKSISKL